MIAVLNFGEKMADTIYGFMKKIGRSHLIPLPF
jgi:hypothetical protein